MPNLTRSFGHRVQTTALGIALVLGGAAAHATDPLASQRWLEEPSIKRPIAPSNDPSRPYNVSYDVESSNYTLINARADAGAFEGKSTFVGSAKNPSQPLTRLESTWTRDLSDDGKTLRMGDSISDPGAWGEAVRFGGVRFGNANDLPSDLVASPKLSTTGTAVVPTTSDLWVDATRNAASQPLAVKGMPAVSASGQVKLNVTDAVGRSRTIAQPLYARTSLLERGESTYSVEAGRVREDFGLSSNRYGGWFAATTLRYGMTRSATLEAHAAQLDATGVMGVDVAKRVGSLGVLSAAVASSRNGEDSGVLTKYGFEHAGERVTVAVRSRKQSEGFHQVGETQADGIRDRTLASVAFKVSDKSHLAVAAATQKAFDDTNEEIFALGHTMQIGRGGSLSAAAGYVPMQSASSSVLISFTYPLGALRRMSSTATTPDWDLIGSHTRTN